MFLNAMKNQHNLLKIRHTNILFCPFCLLFWLHAFTYLLSVFIVIFLIPPLLQQSVVARQYRLVRFVHIALIMKQIFRIKSRRSRRWRPCPGYLYRNKTKINYFQRLFLCCAWSWVQYAEMTSKWYADDYAGDCARVITNNTHTHAG